MGLEEFFLLKKRKRANQRGGLGIWVTETEREAKVALLLCFFIIERYPIPGGAMELG